MSDFKSTDSRILIVDDKQANIDLLYGMLTGDGFANLKATTDPRKAVGLFNEFQPDLILLDLLMPYLSGFQVMEQLKTVIPEGTYLPILVLTADINPDTKLKALASGASDFLCKPFDFIEVNLRINNLLKIRYLQQRLENQNQILEEKVLERTVQLEEAYKSLETANIELQTLDQAKNEFLAIISHEIRTPLNCIIGFTAVLKEDLKNSEFSKVLSYLEDSANRLFRFSDIALLITSLKTKSRNNRREDVLFSDLAEKVSVRLSSKIHEKGLILSFVHNPTLTVQGERELLKICFENILDNAVKYSDEKGKIMVRAFKEGGFVVCEFEDEGKGFGREALKNIFQLFKPGEKFIDQNVGLSLSLVKLIMDAHYGLIEAFNNDGKGATVRLKFVSNG